MRIIDCKQGTREWLEARRALPTASRFAEIITPTGKPSAQCEGLICDLIAEKYYCGPIDDLTEPATAAMRNGTDKEPEARSFYEMEKDCDVQQVGLMVTDDGRFGASPDGLIGDEGGLELKCPNGATHVGYLIKNVLPLTYKPQVHGCLVVSQRKWWDFMSYVPGLPPFIVRVYPDEYTALMATALEVFWKKYQDTLAMLGLPDPVPPPKDENAELSPDELPAMLC